MAHDESLLPWARGERPTPTTDLQAYLERQQVSRCYYLDAVGPTGSRGIVLELTTGAKLVIWAGRDWTSGYTARLLFRWLPPPRIILPRMARAFSGGREADPANAPPDDLQQRIEGALIHGVLVTTRPTTCGGEQTAIEFVGGARLALGAVPIMRATPEGEVQLADIEYVYSEPKRRQIVLP